MSDPDPAPPAFAGHGAASTSVRDQATHALNDALETLDVPDDAFRAPAATGGIAAGQLLVRRLSG
ncbi:MAG: hypothetical protein GEV28_38810 [Actinophytocola sp.]|uniref:hypothetical protein n=1 Tax=Actinophytocola sp. TaxID=1872138 RepID=UPI001320F632|nr:hypothetical protein [Actinophytocola sp.]MPZ86009.1 hypothetical protein [Actinophytocola sp.]